MLTRSAKNMMAIVPLSSSAVCASLQVTNVYGEPYFIGTNFSPGNFPGSKTETFTANAFQYGISLGTDGTAATDADWNLGNTITSGISVVVSSKTATFVNGQPAIKFILTVTNTGTEAITVREVGVKQSVTCGMVPGASTTASNVILIDRTVLDEPVTIQPSDAGIIEYSILASPVTKTVSGVTCAPFLTATDAQIAAMIDAARQGTIDLQADCGWAVGDVRSIHVDAWTGGNNVTNAAQDIDIVITSFGDYMSSGSLFTFDFLESFASGVRMNSTNTNVGGYGGSEMYTTSLPALVNALPEWLRTRLLTFDVYASAGNKSSTIETVSGNKLALRSEVEVFGTATYGASGEGQPVGYYQRSSDVRKKRFGRIASSGTWWLRSPKIDDSSYFCSGNLSGYASYTIAATASGVAPFGCI